MTTIALLGAGGKMGCRITDNLMKSEYRVRHVEVSPRGLQNLKARGLEPVPQDVALKEADVAILAIPDNLIGPISADIVPSLKPGAMLICLDAAAPSAGLLPNRPDVSYVVTHPCHPPVFSDETEPAAQRDFFGGVHAKQHIVVALMQGPEADYARGEAVCRAMFAPVMDANRVTVEQMVILEPALSETTAATCVTVIREGMDEAIRRGVPAKAARDFILGHLRIELAILFNEVDTPFSDGAKKAIEKAKGQMLQPDWKKVFEPENVRATVAEIVRPPSAAAATPVPAAAREA